MLGLASLAHAHGRGRGRGSSSQRTEAASTDGLGEAAEAQGVPAASDPTRMDAGDVGEEEGSGGREPPGGSCLQFGVGLL